MAINRHLARAKGLSEETIKKIETAQNIADSFFNLIKYLDYNPRNEKQLSKLEGDLQRLWGWEEDESKQKRLKEYRFIQRWKGRTFRCKKTGVLRTLKVEDCYEKNFIAVGAGFIDLGVANGYYRYCNVEEITENT